MSEKVALYARVSTDMQADKQFSISFQLRDMRAWCKELDWEVVQEYKDEGYSGTTIHRPAFLQMIAAAEAHKFDRIVVHNVSRFGRSKADAALKDALHESSGTKFAYYLERITGDDDNIAVDLYELISRDTVNKLKALSRRGKREAVLRGVYPCAAPFGYVLPNATSGERGAALIPDKSIAPIVTELFRRYAAGEKKADIVKWLRQSGAPTPAVRAGRPAMGWCHGMWYEGSLQSILTNPAYVGDIVYGKRKRHTSPRGTRVYTQTPTDQWLIYRASHEPLTDRVTFEAVQQRMSRQVVYKDHTPVKAFMDGFGRCATCGGPILFKNKNRKMASWRYYCSYRAKSGEAACAGSISLGRLREHIHGYLERLIRQREAVVNAVKAFNDRTRAVGTPLAQAQDLLARLQSREAALTSASGLVIEASTAARLRSIRRKRAACEANISALRLETVQYEQLDSEQYMASIQTLYALLNDLPALKSDTVRTVFSHIFIRFSPARRDQLTERHMAQLCRGLVSWNSTFAERERVVKELASIYAQGPRILLVPRFAQDLLCLYKTINKTLFCLPKIEPTPDSGFLLELPAMLQDLDYGTAVVGHPAFDVLKLNSSGASALV